MSCKKLFENVYQLSQINNAVSLMRSRLPQPRIPLMPSASLSSVAAAEEKPNSTIFCLPTLVAKGTMPLLLLQAGLRPYSWSMVQMATLHLEFP